MIARIMLVLFALVLSVGSAAAQGNYLIKSGDRISIEVLEDTSLNRQALILPDGKFSFPLAGSVQAAGRTTEQVERAITSRIASNFSVPPSVFVSVVGLSIPRDSAGLVEDDGPGPLVYLLGEVNDPGPKPILPGTTLLQALSQSGGFTKFAATKRVQLRRKDPSTGQPRVYKINFRAISQGAQISQDPVLRNGDVILVPERRLFE